MRAETHPFEGRPFLTAEWRNLVLLNYDVAPALLDRYVPQGTELDSFGARTFVSLVGFQFLATKLGGRLAIPFHSHFDEVNLRFYVRRQVDGEIRRGVVFVAEIVPRRAIAVVARVAYNENYFCYPMKHEISPEGEARRLRYRWKAAGADYALAARTSGEPKTPGNGSVEQFISEHYWGYAKQRDGGTREYRVAHEPWRVWNAVEAGFEGNAGQLYGSEFASALGAEHVSAFVAEGGVVEVFKGRRIEE